MRARGQPVPLSSYEEGVSSWRRSRIITRNSFRTRRSGSSASKGCSTSTAAMRRPDVEAVLEGRLYARLLVGKLIGHQATGECHVGSHL